MPDVSTPFGRISFRTTRHGLSRIDLPPVRGPSPARESGSALDRRVARTLAGYFAGKVKDFAIPLDLTGATPFQRRVLRCCARIPFGQVLTYAELARKAGKPGAARAVGRVMATNPIPVVIPCHRVVDSGLRLRGYGGGLTMKRKLLEREGLTVTGQGARARVIRKS
jgi:methylated-DNA-[protein]-cysteine S-methyltransferase